MTSLRPAFRVLTVLSLALGALTFTGCQQDDKTLSAEDDTNPHFHAATAAIQERNFAEAAKDYEAALRADPDVAQAHYELGLLYGDRLNDPIAAIYHFDQYLKLRPGAENATQAQERLNNAKINFAATLDNSPVQNAQAFAKLQSDNQSLARDLDAANQKTADLTAKLASAQKELATASPNLEPATTPGGAPVPATPVQDVKPPAATAVPVAVPVATPVTVTSAPVAAPAPEAAPASTAKTYTISQGDTLWKISKKFYPGKINEGIEKIKAANTDTLPPGKPLKIGTQIQIP